MNFLDSSLENSDVNLKALVTMMISRVLITAPNRRSQFANPVRTTGEFVT